MDLSTLFEVLAASFDGPEDIEKHAQDALRTTDLQRKPPMMCIH